MFGFITFWTTSLFVNNNLHVWRIPTISHPSPGDSPMTFIERVDRTHAYRVEFCGLEVMRNDNPDGQDTRAAISQLNDIRYWVMVFVSLVSGLLAGYVVNIFWRLTFQPRRSEAG